MTTPSTDKVKLPILAAFGLPALPVAAIGLVMAVYLPNFFAKHVGISLAAVGSAFMIVRLIDMGLDPLLGLGMDKTRSGLGRFRPWMLIGSPFVMAAIWFLFNAQPGMSEVIAPLTGLFSAHRANMIYRSDERLNAAVARMERRDDGAFGVAVDARTILCGVEPSLNWVLTAMEREAIHEDVRRYLADPLMFANFYRQRSTQRRMTSTSPSSSFDLLNGMRFPNPASSMPRKTGNTKRLQSAIPARFSADSR